jgi:hypothetical protein
MAEGGVDPRGFVAPPEKPGMIEGDDGTHCFVSGAFDRSLLACRVIGNGLGSI